MVRLEPLDVVDDAHLEADYDDYPYYDSDAEWWAPTMPPRAFLQNGLVHMTTHWDGSHAYCGAEAVPYGVQLYSTDAVKAYAAQLSEEAGEVTCFECIVRDFDLAPRGRWR